MQILVDADACPVIGIVEVIAKEHGIAQMAVHFTLQHRFKHGTKNILQGILHILYVFRLVLIEDGLC